MNPEIPDLQLRVAGGPPETEESNWLSHRHSGNSEGFTLTSGCVFSVEELPTSLLGFDATQNLILLTAKAKTILVVNYNNSDRMMCTGSLTCEGQS
jgi:hypothetical protein